MDNDEITSVLCVKKEVFVYPNIPPAQSATRGYRAAEWNLDSPQWTLRARVVTRGTRLVIMLEEQDTGKLFAECPVESYPGIEIQSVSDSSRYFVIRLKNTNGQTKFVGIGFANREDSFDILLNIRDHFERLRNEVSAEEALRQLRDGPKLNMSLKEGQTMRIQLKTKKTADDDEDCTGPSQPTFAKPQLSLFNAAPSGMGLLPPPPPGSASRSRGGCLSQPQPPTGASPSLAQLPASQLLSMDNPFFDATPVTNNNNLLDGFKSSAAPPPVTISGSNSMFDFDPFNPSSAVAASSTANSNATVANQQQQNAAPSFDSWIKF